jgi:hypothetical protein
MELGRLVIEIMSGARHVPASRTGAAEPSRLARALVMARLPATKEEARREAEEQPPAAAAGQRCRSLEGVEAHRDEGGAAASASAMDRTGWGSTARRTLSREDKSVEYIYNQGRGAEWVRLLHEQQLLAQG